MFEHIVLATDLSEASDCLTGCLGGLKPLGCTRVTLVYALGFTRPDRSVAELSRFVEPRIKAQQEAVSAQGLNAAYVIAPGRPTEELQRIVSEKNADLLVIGSHGGSISADIVLGSVAMDIVHSVPLPILVVRMRETKESGPACTVQSSDFLGNILYPTDFSPAAGKAFAYLGHAVAAGCRKVSLLHVQTPESPEDAAERLQDLKGRLAESGSVEATTLLEQGRPAQVILDTTTGQGSSLIVMGSQGKSALEEVVLGSVGHQVVRHSQVPVLLIPEH